MNATSWRDSVPSGETADTVRRSTRSPATLGRVLIVDEEDAQRSLREGARTGQFDPELVRVFLELRRTSADGRH
jgi:hypothetical protein